MTLSGDILDYLKAFVGGILVSFTPCVFPLVPITAGFIGVKAAGSKFKGLTLSLVYATGVAITYSILGLLATLTGKIFGAVSSHPITHLFAGIVIIIFGLFMLDIFWISLPQLIKLPQLKKESYFSTFFLGLSSGLIVSPCITPVLGSILVYLTTKKNMLYGATLLFSFAYGMSFLLVVVGTFSAVLVNLPKQGKWMSYIKKAGAFILIGMGIYLITVAIQRWQR